MMRRRVAAFAVPVAAFAPALVPGLRCGGSVSPNQVACEAYDGTYLPGTGGCVHEIRDPNGLQIWLCAAALEDRLSWSHALSLDFCAGYDGGVG